MQTSPQENRWKVDINFLESGDIYFFYKPKKEAERVQGIDDTSRFYIVLDPAGDESPPRYIVIGNKKMPEVSDGGKNSWGFVQIVGGKGFKTFRNPTKTREKTASRPAGEGIYSIIKHRNHTHLVYLLELPRKLGPVQIEFNINKEANCIILERPITVPPSTPDEPFSNFKPVTQENLNKRGTELLFVGVGSDIGRLGISATPSEETIETADIFSKLELNRDRHPTKALISGEWN